MDRREDTAALFMTGGSQAVRLPKEYRFEGSTVRIRREGRAVVIEPLWRYRVHRWEATPEAMYTQSGWFNQERRIAPISRIQTVDSERGPLEQVFGLTNVTVTTASAAGPLRINGLDRDTAQRLVDDLTAAAEAMRGDAT